MVEPPLQQGDHSLNDDALNQLENPETCYVGFKKKREKIHLLLLINWSCVLD